MSEQGAGRGRGSRRKWLTRERAADPFATSTDEAVWDTDAGADPWADPDVPAVKSDGWDTDEWDEGWDDTWTDNRVTTVPPAAVPLRKDVDAWLESDIGPVTGATRDLAAKWSGAGLADADEVRAAEAAAEPPPPRTTRSSGSPAVIVRPATPSDTASPAANDEAAPLADRSTPTTPAPPTFVDRPTPSRERTSAPTPAPAAADATVIDTGAPTGRTEPTVTPTPTVTLSPGVATITGVATVTGSMGTIPPPPPAGAAPSSPSQSSPSQSGLAPPPPAGAIAAPATPAPPTPAIVPPAASTPTLPRAVPVASSGAAAPMRPLAKGAEALEEGDAPIVKIVDPSVQDATPSGSDIDDLFAAGPSAGGFTPSRPRLASDDDDVDDADDFDDSDEFSGDFTGDHSADFNETRRGSSRPLTGAAAGPVGAHLHRVAALAGAGLICITLLRTAFAFAAGMASGPRFVGDEEIGLLDRLGSSLADLGAAQPLLLLLGIGLVIVSLVTGRSTPRTDGVAGLALGAAAVTSAVSALAGLAVLRSELSLADLEGFTTGSDRLAIIGRFVLLFGGSLLALWASASAITAHDD